MEFIWVVALGLIAALAAARDLRSQPSSMGVAILTAVGLAVFAALPNPPVVLVALFAPLLVRTAMVYDRGGLAYAVALAGLVGARPAQGDLKALGVLSCAAIAVCGLSLALARVVRRQGNPALLVAPLGAFALMSLAVLSTTGEGSGVRMLAPYVAVGLAVGALVEEFLPSIVRGWLMAVGACAGIAVATGVGSVTLAVPGAIAVLAALLLVDAKGLVASRAVLTLVVLAGASLAFSEQRGLGIALAAAVAMGVAMSHPTVAMAAAPVAGLAGFRALRLLHPDATRGLDLAQHTALVGIVAGIALVIAGAEVAPRIRRLETFALSGLASCGALVATAMYVGVRGSAALLVGLTLGVATAAYSGYIRPAVAALAASALAGFILGYDRILLTFEWPRDQRMTWILGIFAVAALLAIVSSVMMAKSDASDRVSA
jgi:hypothetical protein